MLAAPHLLRQLAVVIAANLSMLSTGLGLSWTSPTLVLLSNATLSPLGDAITQDEASWIISIGGLAGIPGALLVGFLASAIGRKYSILAVSLPKLAGWILILLAYDVRMIYAARFLHGFSDSTTISLVSMYTSEIASKEIRGSLGTILQLICTLGIVLTLCIGPFLSYMALAIFCTTVVACSAIPILFLPESPYFAYSRGRKDEALKTLTALRASSAQAAEDIKEFEANESKEKPRLYELLQSKATVRAVLIATAVGLGSQLTGFNAVTYSLQTVLESTNTEVRSEIASVVIGVAQLLACVVCTLITERFGRKPILCTTLAMMFVGLAVLGAFFQLSELGYSMTGGLQFIPLTSILVVVCAYSGGLGSIMWPLIAELFSDEARSFGVSVGVTSCVFSTFITTRFFFPLVSAVGSAITYWIFSGCCVLLALFVHFCIPETKGRSFAQIQQLLYKTQ